MIGGRMNEAVLPGAWLGLLGGGQLGRFFTIAARQMGYRVMVLDPDPESPAGMLADAHLIAGYTDERAIAKLAADCAATGVYECMLSCKPMNITGGVGSPANAIAIV